MPILIPSHLSSIRLAISLIAMISASNIAMAQDAKPLSKSGKIPTFSDIPKQVRETQKDIYAKIGDSISNGKTLDSKICQKAFKSCSSYLGGRKNVPGQVKFSVTYLVSYASEDDNSQSEARTKLYKMASQECDQINSYFKGRCTLNNLTVRNNVRNRNFTVTGSAQFTVVQ